MSAYKSEVIIIGTGSINSNAISSQVFSGNNTIALWNIGSTYAVGNVVEYSGAVYRSLTNSNTGNQPDTDQVDWEVVLVSVKDGDVEIAVNGASSDVLQRQNGTWVSLSNSPQLLAMNDNQVSPTPILQYSGSVLPYLALTYTIRRANGIGNAQEGILYIQNDGVSNVEYRHAFSQLGMSVGVIFSITCSGGIVSVNYTSTNQGTTIQFKYTIKGWA